MSDVKGDSQIDAALTQESTLSNLSRLYHLYQVYGEKDAPSVLIPKQPVRDVSEAMKQQNRTHPSIAQVIDLASANGYTTIIRNCSRYRGLVRIQFRPMTGRKPFLTAMKEAQHAQGQGSDAR